jgi:hypothetical protein
MGIGVNLFTTRDLTLRGTEPRELIGMASHKALGQILLEKDIISKSQLDLALRRQQKQKGKYLGQILMEMGVSQSKINQILDSFSKRKPIGQILIDLGVITSAQLEEVLQKQKELQKQGVRKALGAFLIELGYTSHERLIKALSKHFNMPIVSLENFLPSESMQKTIGEKFARKNLIVVLENNLARARLALADPKPFIIEDIKRAFPPGKNLEFFLAYPYEIETCFRKKFDPFSLTKYK